MVQHVKQIPFSFNYISSKKAMKEQTGPITDEQGRLVTDNREKGKCIKELFSL